MFENFSVYLQYQILNNRFKKFFNKLWARMFQGWR